MLLTEKHVIKDKKLYKKIDDYCYKSKNLYNSTNYLITQYSRISYKLKQGEILDSWEKHILIKVNTGIRDYNTARPGKKPLAYVDENNGFVANAYFLFWYLKGSNDYKATPYASSSQSCIQNLCNNWKAFYKCLQKYKSDKSGMLGFPKKPGYLDKDTGRNHIILSNQAVTILDNGVLQLPKFLDGIKVRPKHTDIHQVRIITKNYKVIVELIYEKPVNIPPNIDAKKRGLITLPQ